MLLSLGLIFAYTYKGGLKTIIVTDTCYKLFFLVGSVFFTIYFICNHLNLGIVDAFETVKTVPILKSFSLKTFMTNKFHFAKKILGGMFVTITMVGLDQDLIKKFKL